MSDERLVSGMLAVLDPPEGSFLEVAVRMPAGLVNLTARAWWLSGLSFRHDDAEGRTGTV